MQVETDANQAMDSGLFPNRYSKGWGAVCSGAVPSVCWRAQGFSEGCVIFVVDKRLVVSFVRWFSYLLAMQGVGTS